MDLYVAGHKSKRRHRGKVLLEVGLVLIGLAAVVLVVRHYLSSDTSLGETPALTTTQVSLPEQRKKHINEKIFSFDLPPDWQTVEPPAIAYTIYSWQNTAENKGVRRLDVYVDGAPRLALNRVLPVQANGARIATLGEVSDNCVTFTQNAKNTNSATLTAKWRGVNFLCDTANASRNVSGISAPGDAEGVAVSGAASGTHRFFFVYTDNSASPDFDIFTNAVTSFQAK